MKSMNINGCEINFTERPKHRKVTEARGIMTGEIMKLLDMKDIDPSKGVSDAIKEKITEDPAIASRMSMLQSEITLDQTIILATNLDYSTLQELKEEMYAEEFIELLDKSKEAMGGKNAEDFFAIYPTSTNFRDSKVPGM